MAEGNDRVLEPLIAAANERAVDAEIEKLLLASQQIIAGVLNYYRRRRLLHDEDADDISSIVRTRLLVKLRAIAGEKQTIATFDGYVARLAYNAVNDLFRERYPERAQLKRRVWEIVGTDDRFCSEMTPEGTACGLKARPALAATDPQNLADSLADVLRRAGGSMLLNDAVSILYSDRRVADVSQSDDSRGDEAPAILTRLERRSDIELLWREIQSLDRNQRAALLLNLRASDGGNALAIFILIGVTTLAGIAAAIDASIDDLIAIWDRLPLGDLLIGERLGLTRQQVINARQSARRRLTRKLKSPFGAP